MDSLQELYGVNNSEYNKLLENIKIEGAREAKEKIYTLDLELLEKRHSHLIDFYKDKEAFSPRYLTNRSDRYLEALISNISEKITSKKLKRERWRNLS